MLSFIFAGLSLIGRHPDVEEPAAPAFPLGLVYRKLVAFSSLNASQVPPRKSEATITPWQALTQPRPALLTSSSCS